MNKRIRELADQALKAKGPVATIGDWGRVEWADNVYPQLGDKMYAAVDLEKFAELIVRECIERVGSQYTPVRDSTIEGRPNPFFPELRVRTECEQAVIESGIKSIMALEELIQESTDRWYKENILGDEA
jgi:hypothetical protein